MAEFTKGNKYYDALLDCFNVLKVYPGEIKTDKEWERFLAECRKYTAKNELTENLLVVISSEKNKEFANERGKA